MQQTYLKISLIILAITSLFSCDKNRYDVDLSGVENNIEIIRLEETFANFNNDDFEAQIDDLKANHDKLSEVLIEQVLVAGRKENPNYKVLKRFFLDSNFNVVNQKVKAKYADFENEAEKLNNAFRYIKYYYPNDTMPEKAYTLISGFVVPGFTYDNILGISLDWYMGQGFEYYHNQVFPAYMQRRMDAQYIVPQVVKGWYTDKYPFEANTDGTLLSEMIYWGKQLEFAKMMMPNVHDSIIIEYTQANLKWCGENEGMMYKHFVDRKLWFSTDQNQTYRYVSDGPYTIAPDVPIESAPRIGWYVGWQIVRNYLQNEKGNPVEILFENNDYQSIFKKARYKP
ncbi:MAG: hypothetical protein ACPGLV_08285 [Bacteroidia bacterium]